MSSKDPLHKMIILLLLLRNIFVYLLGWLGLLILAILVLISALKVFVIKQVLGVFGESFEVLSGLDASLQYIHPTTVNGSEVVITGINVLEGRLDLEAYRRQMQERMIDARKSPGGPKRYPGLTKHIVRKLGYYTWVEEENFSMDHHLRVHPDRFTDDDSLIDHISSMVHLPFAKNHSPWEFVFILREPTISLTGEGTEVVQHGYAIVSRMSHSLLDGMGIMQIMKELCDETSRTQIDELTKNGLLKISRSSKMTTNPFIHYMMSKTRSLSFNEWCKVVLNGLQIILVAPWGLVELCLHREKYSLHSAKLNGHKLIAMSDPVDLQKVKDISLVYNCSINTVFFCCLGSALNKYDPSASHVRVVIPLAVMPPFNQFSLNGSSATFADIPLQHENVEKRLEVYCKILTKALMTPETLIRFVICNLTGNHLPLIVAKALFSAANYTMVASNLCGPPFELFQHNSTLKDIFFIPNNIQSAGIGFSAMSYNGKIRLAFAVDKALAPDNKIAKKLMDECIMELKNLHALAKERWKSYCIYLRGMKSRCDVGVNFLDSSV